jgi:hypothetical protein
MYRHTFGIVGEEATGTAGQSRSEFPDINPLSGFAQRRSTWTQWVRFMGGGEQLGG